MRLINADALIEQLKSSSAYNDYVWSMYADEFIEDIENAPSIDIVRCDECEWYDIDNEGVPYCSLVSGLCGDVTHLDFCSRGERKDDEDD